MEELNSIQCELNAPKGQYNSFGKYKYRSCEDILASVKPLLKKYGCTLTLSDDVLPVGSRIYIKATATLTNGKGESVTTTAFAREEETKKGMDGSQVTGASSSYARKYALNGLFAIDDTADADKLNTSPEYTQQQQQQTAKTQQQQQAKPKQTGITGAQLKLLIAEVNAKQAIEELVPYWQKVYQEHPEMQTNDMFNNALFQKASALGIAELETCKNNDDIELLIQRWTEIWAAVLKPETPFCNAIIAKRQSFPA